MSTVGVDRRWDRTAKIGARIGLRGPLILLCVVLVFAAFFAIGRATRAGGGAGAEAAASLPPVAPFSARVPVSLQTATPIETTLLPPPPPRPHKAKPFSALRGRASLQTTTPEASRAVTPAPRVSEPVAPPPAPVHESAPSRPSAGGSSGGGGQHSSSGSGSDSGGGTFESSG